MPKRYKYNSQKCTDAMADGKFEPNMCLDCSYLERCPERWAKWVKASIKMREKKLCL